MKGIVMSSALMMFLMSLVFSVGMVISFESDRFQIYQAMKSALRSTMMRCLDDVCDHNDAFSQFVSDFQWMAEQYKQTDVELMGFNQDPLLIRIRVSVKGGLLNMFDIICDETMIEEGVDAET